MTHLIHHNTELANGLEKYLYPSIRFPIVGHTYIQSVNLPIESYHTLKQKNY